MRSLNRFENCRMIQQYFFSGDEAHLAVSIDLMSIYHQDARDQLIMWNKINQSQSGWIAINHHQNRTNSR